MSSTPTPQLKLYNTLTREKQTFTPLDASDVRMYVCGITPYDYAHIGNLRTMVVFDVMYRLLKHLYPKVTYVRNYTDIDDKIVERAAEEGKEPFALAAEFIEIFERDMAALGMLEPTEKPRVSEHMVGIVKMVDDLLEKGFAYVTESGDVIFDVPKFNDLGKPHDSFGHIARRTFDNLQARVEEDAEKRDPRDFPVWKANAKSSTKMEQAFTPADLGAKHFTAPGRPGWHIECSVMSESILGKAYKPGHAALFDIHGGGEDLAFPHHSCEIAQTEALHPTCTMSSIWMHAAFLTVNGQKMSKSLGNFLRVEDALEKYSPEAIRLWLLQTHYRKPVDFSDEALQAAENRVSRIKRTLTKFLDVQSGFTPSAQAKKHAELAVEMMLENTVQDDLDTSALIAHFNSVLNVMEGFTAKPESTAAEWYEKFTLLNNILGLYDMDKTKVAEEDCDEEVLSLLELRKIARLNRDFKESDELRDLLKTEHGILVEDGPTGQTWRRL